MIFPRIAQIYSEVPIKWALWREPGFKPVITASRLVLQPFHAMDKCWFVLRQTHYPPPQEEDDGNGATRQSGALCLGHFIEDLKHLDQVINVAGPEPFPLDMPVYRTQPRQFKWEVNKDLGFEASVTAKVPVAAIASVNSKAEVGIALQRSVQRYWEIEQLDTMILQPTRSYINHCLASEPIVEHLKRKKLAGGWSLFMITGLMIARGKVTGGGAESHDKNLHAGAGVAVPAIAEASLGGAMSGKKSISASAEYSTDFVWAVRLSKITKGVFDSRWSQTTFSKGATFNMNTKKESVETVLSTEGLANADKITVEDEDSVEFFVI
ncbi:hypothetical protein DL768_009422 [Monosporascus sp. mg162]|nr:hypothetical protein DL768_009422 [Monosporascus sp. mg162]